MGSKLYLKRLRGKQQEELDCDREAMVQFGTASSKQEY